MKMWIFGVAALSAAMCFGATTEDGVTKERRGALGPNDMVVTDVDTTGIVAARTYTKDEIDRRIATDAPVRSVNGKTGRVVLGANDVGALPNNRDDLKASANFRNAVWDVQIRGGGIDTNTVDILANSAVVTNALTVATTNRVALLESSKADKSALAAHTANTDNPHAVTAKQVGAVPFVEDANGEKTAVTIGIRKSGESVGVHSFANGEGVTASIDGSHAEGGGTSAYGVYSHAEGVITTASGDSSHSEGNGTTASGPNSHAEGDGTTASGSSSHAEGGATTASGDYSHAEGNGTTASGMNSHAEGEGTTAAGAASHAEGDSTSADGKCSHTEGLFTGTYGVGSHAEGEYATASGECAHAEGFNTYASGKCSHAEGINSHTRTEDSFAFAWNGDETMQAPYISHGAGTFNINPAGGLDGFWIGEQTLYTILTNKADKADISSTNPTFSNAVLAVGLNIDTNSVAVLNEIAETFGGFPLGAGETATTVGGLLAALAAAIAWLKKNKVQTLKLEDESIVKTADNGVAKLDDFFIESNSLLTGTIDARLPYSLYAVPSTGLLKDRAINTTSLATVTVPDNFTDLLVRASVASSLSVTMQEATTKYGDTFPGEAGEYLITITKTGASEAYVRTIKLGEVA